MLVWSELLLVRVESFGVGMLISPKSVSLLQHQRRSNRLALESVVNLLLS
jgi:hypothetical protein